MASGKKEQENTVIIYQDENGITKVSVRFLDEDIWLTQNQMAEIYDSVADHGSGIPEDKLALVTEPFYRVDKARSRNLGGAGLGLSICHMIAEAHGGRLVIESALGAGTTVSVDLPHAKEDERNE